MRFNEDNQVSGVATWYNWHFYANPADYTGTPSGDSEASSSGGGGGGCSTAGGSFVLLGLCVVIATLKKRVK
jgi:hypothetical protein